MRKRVGMSNKNLTVFSYSSIITTGSNENVNDLIMYSECVWCTLTMKHINFSNMTNENEAIVFQLIKKFAYTLEGYKKTV